MILVDAPGPSHPASRNPFSRHCETQNPVLFLIFSYGLFAQKALGIRQPHHRFTVLGPRPKARRVA